MNEVKIKEYRNAMENIKVFFFFELTILVLVNTAIIADMASGCNLLVKHYLIIGVIMIACISAIVSSMAALVLGFVLIRKHGNSKNTKNEG